MNQTQEQLRNETEKWLDKLDERLEDLSKGVEQMENVLAYRDDTRHFLEEGDFIRAFESIVYAWGILETLERIGRFDKST